MRRSTHHHRSARLRPTPLLPVCLLLGTALACSPEPPSPIPLPGDHLIVAITDAYGDLNPIARYAEGIWDRPSWATPAGWDRLAAAPAGDSSTWRWPDGRRTWPVSERPWDSIGHPVQAVAVNVPDRWHFYSDSAQDQPLVTRGLRLADNACGISWWVRTQAEWREVFPRLGDLRTAGVSLSRRPTAIPPTDEWPAVERIVEELGLLSEESPWGDSRFIWIGVFRFEDMTIGVLLRIGPGFGVRQAVIELQGDRPRVVGETRRELC